jgi:glutamate transport system substrate-binding protein
MRGIRLFALLVALVVAGIVVVVTIQNLGPPSRQDLLEQAGLVGKRELLIGVKDDIPGVSQFDRKTQEFRGFEIEVAYMIAADLGYRRSEVRFLAIETEDRARMQARDRGGAFVTVDLVIATYSITEERKKQPGVSFSAPYLRTEQSVMTRADHPRVEALTDLKDEQVCTTSTSTSGGAARQAGLVLTSKNRISECADGLRAGTFAAVTSDAAILAGFVAQAPDLFRLHDIGLDTDERWGVNTGGNDALRELVDLSLYHSLHDPQDHRWEDAFDRYLRPEQVAAQLQQVAVTEQPDVPKVTVREWPWDRAAGEPSSGRAFAERAHQWTGGVT